MNQDTINTERIGHGTGMLSTCSTKGDQCVARDIVSASYRDLLYCIGHVLDSDPEKAARHLFGRKFAYLGRERPETLGDQFSIDGQIGVWTKDLWKEIRRQTSQHYIAIGHGERTALTITCRPRVSSCAFRAHPETRSVESANRTAPGRHGMDMHHGRTNSHSGNFGLKSGFTLASEMRYIGRSSAHVEPDDPIKTGPCRDLRGSNDSSRRAGQDGILAVEQCRIRQAAVGLHEEQRYPR